MSQPYIYEFLFRGGEDSGPDDDTWHVWLARKVVGMDGVERTVPDERGPLTPEKAAEEGFTLDSIVRDLNTAAVSQAAKAAQYRQERDEARGSTEPTAEEAKPSLLKKLSFGLFG